MESFVTVKTFTFPHEAHILQGRLESEGIETFLKDELTVQVHPFASNAIGGVKLQVKKEDYDKALEILGLEKEPSTDDADDAIEIIDESKLNGNKQCPFCGSANIGKMTSGNWLTYIPFLIIGFILPIYRRSYKCFDCERRWAVRKRPVINWIKKNRPKM